MQTFTSGTCVPFPFRSVPWNIPHLTGMSVKKLLLKLLFWRQFSYCAMVILLSFLSLLSSLLNRMCKQFTWPQHSIQGVIIRVYYLCLSGLACVHMDCYWRRGKNKGLALYFWRFLIIIRLYLGHAGQDINLIYPGLHYLCPLFSGTKRQKYYFIFMITRLHNVPH